MIYLLLSIFFSSGLFVIFKYFTIYKIDVLKAIVVNYLVAFLLGFLLADRKIAIEKLHLESWFFSAFVLGILFVSIFFVMAMSAQKNGISTTSIAGKMSVVIPVFFGIILYNETVTFLKMSGILLALIAVYLSSVKEEKSTKKATFLFPVLLFLGSGVIDTLLKYVQKKYVADQDVAIFSSSLFGFAAVFGVFILLLKTIKKREVFGFKNLIAGVVLGIPNYFSIVFLIKALQYRGFESSIIFTVNNLGIVMVSIGLSLLLFKEKFSFKNKVGFLLAILAIVLVVLS